MPRIGTIVAVATWVVPYLPERFDDFRLAYGPAYAEINCDIDTDRFISRKGADDGSKIIIHASRRGFDVVLWVGGLGRIPYMKDLKIVVNRVCGREGQFEGFMRYEKDYWGFNNWVKFDPKPRAKDY